MSRIYLFIIIALIFFSQHTSASDITLSSPRTTIKAQIGEELHITCKAIKCDKPLFTWASVMDNTLSGTINNVGQYSTLTMKVSGESDGSYRCTVSCSQPPGEKRFKIVVYSFPSDPNLHISSLVVGEQSRITCTLLNIYRSEMMTAQILLDTEIVAEYDGAKRGQAKQGMKNISLFHDIILQERNEGKKIECVAGMAFEDAENEPIERHTSMELNLMYPPVKPQIRLHPSKTVRAGETISLTCSSESRPQAYIQWVKLDNGKELEMSTDDKGRLILPSAEPEDSGVYICYAKNNIGKTSSQVEISVQGLPDIPRITIQPGATVIAGQAVTITCFANANMDTHVKLWKVSEEGDKLFLETEGDFFIKEADPIDTAVYKCTAENLYGLTEASESLTVTYPPRETTLSSSAVDVNEGDTVTLSCVSKGMPKPSISLYKLLLSGERVFLSEGPLVTLTNVTSGVYQCQANNFLGSQEDKLELRLRFPPKNTYIAITPSSYVKEGDKVHIRCTSEAYPAPRMVLKMRSDHGLIELESENGQYKISQAKVEHAGTFICESSNVVGQQTTEAMLTVQVPPKNTHITITPSLVVREGDNVHIRCSLEASPAPRLVLKKKTDHGLIELESESGQYNISHAGVEHIGTYICESTNVVGQQVAETILTVQVPPKNTHITITPSPVVREGDSVQITCTSEASPTPRLVLKMKTDHGMTELESESGQYNISHAGVGHIGTYICESKNVVGQQVAETILTVQVPQRNTTVVVTPSQNVTEGDTITITCETHSIPSPTIILQKVCARNSTVLHTSNGTFTLHNVTRNDTGTYTLNIISSDGNETAVISIIVAERQQSPRFNPISVIIGSIAFASAGIIGVTIYYLKQAKGQGSYSLVKALRSKV